ncbi:TadE/TadG family type IV pilus assembly protein [Roseovarius dicentrarchi]|uniref:TadE/TadG family type IV pilus assembly protein n=1 Tax=Roseovarius dicentrarchi TaxID=2250573 RepID=UPI001EF0EE2A|nr:TadE/TadG family type IV pilus assembly protein [Roseovarius dicentrarchi]
MKNHLRHALRRLMGLARREDGNASVEFVVIFPIYFALLAMSIELSMITLRQTLLERGLDMAVRDIRLGTGEFVQNYDTEAENEAALEQYHTKIKQRICDEAFTIADCLNSIKLEMVRSDMRNLVSLGGEVMCTDREETGKATYRLMPGVGNDLMFLRACVKYDPLFPTWHIARSMTKDNSGQLAIVTMSAFVMEPL